MRSFRRFPPTGRGLSPGAGRRAARVLGVGGLLALGLLVGACSSTRVTTHTPRTATEQLLVSVSTERAVEALVLPGVAGRRVALELVGVAPGDPGYDDLPYLKAALEDRLRREGATLVASPEEAERVVAVRVGALGTTLRQTAFGIPSVPLLVGATPEIKFYRTLTQNGYTKLRVAQRGADGAPTAGDETVMERVRYRLWKILFVTIRAGDAYPKELAPD